MWSTDFNILAYALLIFLPEAIPEAKYAAIQANIFCDSYCTQLYSAVHLVAAQINCNTYSEGERAD
jgi:hypothetical protein